MIPIRDICGISETKSIKLITFLRRSKPFQYTNQCFFLQKNKRHLSVFELLAQTSKTQSQALPPSGGIPNQVCLFLFSLQIPTAQHLHIQINQGYFYESPKCIYLNLSGLLYAYYRAVSVHKWHHVTLVSPGNPRVPYTKGGGFFRNKPNCMPDQALCMAPAQ